MRRFEYKTLTIESPHGLIGAKFTPEYRAEIEKTLNQLGAEGWELVAVWNPGYNSDVFCGMHYFRREI